MQGTNLPFSQLLPGGKSTGKELRSELLREGEVNPRS
jgi:hypothetical protein